MNVVYLIQAGEDGPVLIGGVAERSLRRHLATLQHGNHEALSVREMLDGDERLERRLHVTFEDYRVRGDWYRPEILQILPDDLERVPRDEDAEERRLAALELAELARETSA